MKDEIGYMKSVENKYGEFLIYRRTQQFADGFGRTIANLTYEKPIVEILEKADYRIFVDVGANFGYHSVIASKHCDIVYAFEPHPLRYGFLIWNTKDFKNIICYNELVGDDGNYLTDRFNGMVGSRKTGRERILPENKVNKVSLETIVDGIYGNVLIKIDTEGNELDVLNSGLDIIDRENTEWIVEYHAWVDYPRDVIFKLFKDYQYERVMNRLDKNVTELYYFWR